MKTFQFFTKNHYTNSIIETRGGYFDVHKNALGKNPFTYKQAEKANVFSKTVLKRLKGLKPGTELFVVKIGSINNLIIKRIDNPSHDKHILLINEQNKLKDDISKIREEIKKICPDLHQQKLDLEKRLRKVNEKLSKYTKV